MGIERSAVCVADTLIEGERGAFTAERLLDGLFGGDRPRMVKIEIGKLARHQRSVSEASKFVLRGMPGDGQRGGYGFTDGVVTTAGGARSAFALADIERDAEALGAIELDRLNQIGRTSCRE